MRPIVPAPLSRNLALAGIVIVVLFSVDLVTKAQFASNASTAGSLTRSVGSIVAGLGLMAAMVHVARSPKSEGFVSLAGLALVAGLLGNAVRRAGFIELGSWPPFSLADLYITLAIFVLAPLDVLRVRRSSRRRVPSLESR